MIDDDVDADAPTDEMTGLRAVLVGFGAVCLGAAVVFGILSALAGDHPRCVGDCDARAVPIVVWVVIVAAAGLLALVWAAARGSDHAGFVVTCLGWVVTAVGLIYLIAGFPAPRVPRFAAEPVNPATYVLTAVYWLGLAGAVATAIGWRWKGHRMRRRTPGRAVVAGAVVGVVVALVVCGVSWWAVTDVRYVDATTASDAAIAPLPASLGHKRFRTSLGVSSADTDSGEVHLESAGAGFVVWSEALNGVTAYDAAGQRRWHYRRTEASALRLTALRVYDEGRTIVVALSSPTRSYYDHPLIVGLDAVTGHELWSATGPEMSGAMFAGDLSTRSPFLVDRGEEHWTAFDTRTGDQRWQIPTPTPCGHAHVGDTASVLAVVTQCPTNEEGDQYVFRFVTVDPATGEVLLDQELMTRPGPDIDTVVQAAGMRGTAVESHWSQGAMSHSAQLYIDAATGQVTDFGDAQLEALPWPAGGFVVEADDTARLYGDDGTPRCVLPDSFAGWADLRFAPERAAWLPDQFVVAERYGGHTAQTVDRRTCRVDTVTVAQENESVVALTAAPGALVVLASTDDGFVVDGYAAE